MKLHKKVSGKWGELQLISMDNSSYVNPPQMPTISYLGSTSSITSFSDAVSTRRIYLPEVAII